MREVRGRKGKRRRERGELVVGKVRGEDRVASAINNAPLNALVTTVHLPRHCFVIYIIRQGALLETLSVTYDHDCQYHEHYNLYP